MKIQLGNSVWFIAVVAVVAVPYLSTDNRVEKQKENPERKAKEEEPKRRHYADKRQKFWCVEGIQQASGEGQAGGGGTAGGKLVRG